MASVDETKSSATNELTDSALINTEPDLTVIRQDRRTDCGFLIEESRLPRCIPLPANKLSRRSWVWEHGVLIGRLNHQGEPVACWLCTSCYHEPRSSRPSDLSAYLIKATTATNRIIDHLVDRHYYGRKGEPPESYKSKKRKHNTLEEAWMNAEHAHKEVFNTSGWKAAYCKWVACSGISLRQATSKELVSLLTYQHPKLSSMPITSPTTAEMWMKQCFDHNKDKVKQSLATAKSSLTISFDGWKANNDVLDLLGVVAHFIDSDYKLRTIVIGLRNTYGSHTGANIAQHLFEVLHDYQIRGTQVAYFASDNASNNHTALQKLQPKITSLDPLTSRLRCAGHIYNLVCNAILYGFNEDAFADASQVTGEGDVITVTNFNAVLHTVDDEAKLHAWRKKGPVGRLHNTMIHINTNSKRRGLFESRQREVIDEAAGDPLNTRIYKAIVNGGIRWNSTYLMIKRAMLLKDAIHNYQDDPASEFDRADYLTQEDWLQLREMCALLQPLFEASERVQTQGTTHGALHDVLTTMDYCLTHLETAKNKLTNTDPVTWRTSVNLGWQKLDQYYTMTDCNPAYIMAVFLHPCYKKKWFEKHWAKGDVTTAMRTVNKVYLDAKRQYSDEVPIRTSQKRELEGIDAYNKLDDSDEDYDDDLRRYINDERAPLGIDPLQWWRDHQQHYPVLRHLAFTLLAAPASTAADERLFSTAGNVVNEQRPHTKADLAEAVQCLRSWYQEGII